MPRIIPPLICAVCFGLAVALDLAFPLGTLFLFPWNLLGLMPISLGLWIGLWALRVFREQKTTFHAHSTPRVLVIEGPYRFSRNPMYASLLLILGGSVWLLGALMPWLGVGILPALIEVLFIRPEEKRLEFLFGEDYRKYRKRVGRWIEIRRK